MKTQAMSFYDISPPPPVSFLVLALSQPVCPKMLIDLGGFSFLKVFVLGLHTTSKGHSLRFGNNEVSPAMKLDFSIAIKPSLSVQGNNLLTI